MLSLSRAASTGIRLARPHAQWQVPYMRQGALTALRAASMSSTTGNTTASDASLHADSPPLRRTPNPFTIGSLAAGSIQLDNTTDTPWKVVESASFSPAAPAPAATAATSSMASPSATIAPMPTAAHPLPAGGSPARVKTELPTSPWTTLYGAVPASAIGVVLSTDPRPRQKSALRKALEVSETVSAIPAGTATAGTGAGAGASGAATALGAAAASASIPSKNPATGAGAVAAPAVKKPLKEKIKEVCRHYWLGSRQLATEANISWRLLKRVLRGHVLTRRERRQLIRTTSDMFRLVPFIVILVVPFMEIALPLLLKLFPNMLPSTFEDSHQAEERKHKLLKMRLEVASFLQETVENMAVSSSSNNDVAKLAAEFSTFFSRIRSTGEQPSTSDILRFARLFEDQITLDNLPRPQLVAMCRFMGVSSLGTTPLLRNRLRQKIRKLKEDDLMIATEGIHTLNNIELQAVCIQRGIRTTGQTTARLRSELSQWLDLHLNQQVPLTLLILSRIFSMSDPQSGQKETAEQMPEALRATLSSMPDSIVREVQVDMDTAAGRTVSAEKLAVLQTQEYLISKEHAEMQADREEDARIDAEAKVSAGPVADEALLMNPAAAIAIPAPAPPASASKVSDVAAAVKAAVIAPAAATAVALGGGAGVVPLTTALQPTRPPMTAQQRHYSANMIILLGDILSRAVAQSPVGPEKAHLAELIEDRQDFLEAADVLRKKADQLPVKESPTSRMLSRRVDSLIMKIRSEIMLAEAETLSEHDPERASSEGINLPREHSPQLAFALANIELLHPPFRLFSLEEGSEISSVDLRNLLSLIHRRSQAAGVSSSPEGIDRSGLDPASEKDLNLVLQLLLRFDTNGDGFIPVAEIIAYADELEESARDGVSADLVVEPPVPRTSH
ncbi:hypothetical protein H696_00302 [Fonticula alba]|uniref:Leucine zipper-EF-hand-containing transmembrane protein 1 n=1 Tax=Fonticula alba TaxID=691883 RepID=A0A058ZEC6_FONAL|nr:hypothetical protein H696_00302 [Fonticula alba]KCV72724.1 hypothetical protein H696_00302 [Fonticula alba]|eukprot:XP_009492425.1 hypothetical protein H696_00302 [Fonticula alba]